MCAAPGAVRTLAVTGPVACPLSLAPPAAWSPASGSHRIRTVFLSRQGQGPFAQCGWVARAGTAHLSQLLHMELLAGSCSRGYLMATQGHQLGFLACAPCQHQPPAGTGCGLSPNLRGNLLEDPDPVSTQCPGSLKEQGALSHSFGWT